MKQQTKGGALHKVWQGRPRRGVGGGSVPV